MLPVAGGRGREEREEKEAEGEVRKHVKAGRKYTLPKLHGICYKVTKFSTSSRQIKQIKMNIVLYAFNFLQSREWRSWEEKVRRKSENACTRLRVLASFSCEIKITFCANSTPNKQNKMYYCSVNYRVQTPLVNWMEKWIYIRESTCYPPHKCNEYTYSFVARPLSLNTLTDESETCKDRPLGDKFLSSLSSVPTDHSIHFTERTLPCAAMCSPLVSSCLLLFSSFDFHLYCPFSLSTNNYLHYESWITCLPSSSAISPTSLWHCLPTHMPGWCMMPLLFLCSHSILPGPF